MENKERRNRFIIRNYLKGAPIKVLSRIYGLKESSVKAYLFKARVYGKLRKKKYRERNNRIINMMKQGYKTSYVAHLFRISHWTVKQILYDKGLGLNALQAPAIEKRNDEVCNLYRRGNPTRFIAKFMKLDVSTVYEILKQKGIFVSQASIRKNILYPKVFAAIKNNPNMARAARELGMPYATIRVVLRRNGIRVSDLTKPGMEKRHIEVRRLYQNGMPVKRIAKTLKLERTTVLWILGRKDASVTASRAGKSISDASVMAAFHKGLASARIARELGLSTGRVNLALLRNGIGLRGLKKPLIEKRDNKVCRLYRKGMKISGIKKKTNLAIGTIFKILRKKGIATRLGKRASDETIISAIKETLDTAQVARKYGLSLSLVKGILYRKGIRLRGLKKSLLRKRDNEVCKLYQDGMKTTQIEKLTKLRIETIYKILKRRGIATRSSMKKRIPDSQVVSAVKKSMNVIQVAQKLGLSKGWIRDILARNGVRINDLKRSGLEKRDQTILRLYKKGMTAVRIGKIMNLHYMTIHRILKRKGGVIKKEILKKKLINDKRVIRAVKKYINIARVAGKLGLSRSVVKGVMKRNGIRLSVLRKPGLEKRNREVIKLYKKGVSLSLISIRMKIRIDTIYKILKRKGG